MMKRKRKREKTKTNNLIYTYHYRLTCSFFNSMCSLSTFLHSFLTMANINFLFSAPGYLLLMDFPNSLTFTLPSPIASMISCSVMRGAGVSFSWTTIDSRGFSFLIGADTALDSFPLISLIFAACGFHSPSGKLAFQYFLVPLQNNDTILDTLHSQIWLLMYMSVGGLLLLFLWGRLLRFR